VWNLVFNLSSNDRVRLFEDIIWTTAENYMNKKCLSLFLVKQRRGEKAEDDETGGRSIHTDACGRPQMQYFSL
jgi:hypothetical protein